MRYLSIVLLSLASLYGCTATQQADQKFENYAAERAAYYACGYKAGAQLRGRNMGADFYLLTSSARARCGSERSALIEKITQTYSYSIWQRLIAIMDKKFDEAVSAGVTS